MAVRYAGTNISLYTVAGIALASTGTNFTLAIENASQDAGLITRPGKNNQPVKKSGTLTVERNGVVTGATRVSHINVSAFTIGGTSYLDVLSSYSLSGSFDQVMQSGVGEAWEKPQVVAKDYAVSVTLDVSTGDALALAQIFDGTDFADNDQAVSITIDSVPITIPLNAMSYSLGIARYDKQKITLEFMGADPGAGDYPTAPTGTTSLLEKALNAPFTEVAFSIQNAISGDTGGIAASGNCVWSAFSISVEDGALVGESYTWKTYGTVTVAASS